MSDQFHDLVESRCDAVWLRFCVSGTGYVEDAIDSHVDALLWRDTRYHHIRDVVLGKVNRC